MTINFVDIHTNIHSEEINDPAASNMNSFALCEGTSRLRIAQLNKYEYNSTKQSKFLSAVRETGVSLNSGGLIERPS